MPADTDTDPRHAGGGHWRCRIVDADGRWISLTVVRSDHEPDGANVDCTVEQAAVAIGDAAVVTAHFDENRTVVGLQARALLGESATTLWFAELRETAARPPAVNLLAFRGHGVRAGSLLDADAAAEAGASSDDQLAAVRWYPATGEVDQIYVSPAHRRQGLASALVMAAATLAAARDWPRFWGDGQRTELGEQWRDKQAWRERAASLTHVAPPMTPGSS